MSDEEKNNDLEIHPDRILEDTAEIIERAKRFSDTSELLASFNPYVILVVTMHKMFIDAGFRKKTAEEMVQLVWYKLFGSPYGGWNEYGGDSEDDEDV